MKSKVYLETSIVSYLASRPSRDILVAANQQVTREWWETWRNDFELYVSQLVVTEASSGDPSAAQERIRLIADVPLLRLNEAAVVLANRLIQDGSLPAQSLEDALHIAVATVNGMDYLLTWNFKHIANAVMRSKIERACRAAGYEPPTICTPQELVAEE